MIIDDDAQATLYSNTIRKIAWFKMRRPTKKEKMSLRADMTDSALIELNLPREL